MAVIDFEAFTKASKDDPEFRRAMRYYDGTITLRVGSDEMHRMDFTNGESVEQVAGPGRIEIEGTEEHWINLLQSLPKPFYQCLQSTAVKHGMKMTDTNETFAYLPALNRMVQIMRDLRKAG
jgi:hypothetical protein